ncbi:leucine-rich repeat and transmembrane domain-containing protein 2-like [Vespula pensylvanica]|nr:leucine-rich repeat and transmembrane domain-containing protein 2-like [Vespula pensylvanica]
MKCCFFFLVFYLFGYVCSEESCRTTTSKMTKTVTFDCTELNTLQKYLDTAQSNTTNIMIYGSNLNNIAGHAFVRFGATLRVLDLHENNIEVLDRQVFVGLINLNELILWGNRLTWISSDWFINLYNLRTLDLSFNLIQSIDYNVFPLLSRVENLYLDYNDLKVIDFNFFVYMASLKKIKFGKNPWNWGYRALLTWQMENQNVDYSSEWDDWNWMSNVIKDCTESGEGEIPSDSVIDCAVRKLLDFTYDTLHFSPIGWANDVGCAPEARRLISCARPRNVTGNTDYQTIRMILQDYSRILLPMIRAHSPLSYTSNPEL